jgi:hypothetical protein
VKPSFVDSWRTILHLACGPTAMTSGTWLHVRVGFGGAGARLVDDGASFATDYCRRCFLLASFVCGVLLPVNSARTAELGRLAAAPTDDPSGVVRLRTLDPSLTGDGVAIALVDPTAWVNPATSGQPAEKFFYVDGDTVTQTAPHTYGDHASVVSASMVGTGTGGNPAVWRNSMAPGIGRFYSYAANGFMQRTIPEQKPLAGGVRIVSQPFGFDTPLSYEQAWDDFAARHNVLFVSSSGGVVAVLMQAALRGDGGAGTAAAASDARTLKAMILNGATKQTGWHNSATVPLDEAQGAGMINVFNAHAQLAGGRLAPGRLGTLAGWDLRTLSSAEADGCTFYEFTLAADPVASDSTPPSITVASTIVWNRQVGQTAINQLTLELYDADTNTLVPGGTSRSTVDNLQMIYLPAIKPGTYQLRVGKPFSANQVTAEETYALAFFAAASVSPDSGDPVCIEPSVDAQKRQRLP